MSSYFSSELLSIRTTSRNLIQFAACSFIVLTQISCSAIPDEWQIWRQVPIQMARVSQTESYRQVYLINADSMKNDDKLTENEKLDRRMDQIFIRLIGQKNWQNLKNIYGVHDIRDEVMTGKIRMEGIVNFTAYLDPLDHDYVVMEGSGRFFAIRTVVNTILLSGDYHIPPQRYRINDLKSECIPLDINIYTTRIPGKITYYHGATIRYDLKIRNYKKNVFSVNYQSDHLGYLDLNSDGSYQSDELMASLTMNRSYNHAKLIDLSGLEYVKTQYKDKSKGKAKIELEIADLKMESEAANGNHRTCVAKNS